MLHPLELARHTLHRVEQRALGEAAVRHRETLPAREALPASEDELVLLDAVIEGRENLLH
jgi:hypothetical protein